MSTVARKTWGMFSNSGVGRFTTAVTQSGTKGWQRNYGLSESMLRFLPSMGGRRNGVALLAYRMRPILRTAKPQIDGFLHAFRQERHLYLSSFPGRCVSGVQDLHNDQPIFSSCLGLLFAPRATCEVRHLLREAVVPQLLENWIAPPFCARRLLHGVAITILAIRGERVAHVKIGVGHALRAMHLDPVVHSTTPPPAVLDNAHCTALTFQNANSFVVSSRL